MHTTSHYWTMLQRPQNPGHGVGKWKIDSREPMQVYRVLTQIMHEGGLAEVSAIKVRTVAEREIETVYLYCAPYSDIVKIFRVATELFSRVRQAELKLEQELRYKTDLQTFWQKVAQTPKDSRGKPLEWHGNTWLYSYDGVRSAVNRNMLLLHQELESCDPTALTELASLRRQLPSYVLAHPQVSVDERIEIHRDWLTVIPG